MLHLNLFRNMKYVTVTFPRKKDSPCEIQEDLDHGSLLLILELCRSMQLRIWECCPHETLPIFKYLLEDGRHTSSKPKDQDPRIEKIEIHSEKRFTIYLDKPISERVRCYLFNTTYPKFLLENLRREYAQYILDKGISTPYPISPISSITYSNTVSAKSFTFELF